MPGHQLPIPCPGRGSSLGPRNCHRCVLALNRGTNTAKARGNAGLLAVLGLAAGRDKGHKGPQPFTRRYVSWSRLPPRQSEIPRLAFQNPWLSDKRREN